MVKKIKIGIPLIQNELNGRTGWVAGLYFIKNTINALATLPSEQVPEIIVFTPENFQENLHHDTKPPWLNYVYLANEDLEKTIHQFDCDIIFPFIHFSSLLLKGKVIGWITDYQDRVLPHFFSEEELYYRHMLADYLVGYAEKLLCISQCVLDDLKKYYPEFSEKGEVIYFRSILPESAFSHPPHQTLQQLSIHEKYIYLPNQFWIHKNHHLVFEAWNALKRQGFQGLLVCTGFPNDYRRPDYYQKLLNYIEANDLQNQIRILGFVDRDTQIQIYRGAAAVLQPSQFEGWNTSLEDAKAMGKTIIVSDIAIHREQCRNEAIYFNPTLTKYLVETIKIHWDKLPNDFDAANEKKARLLYQTDIKQFAEDILHLFEKINAGQQKFSTEKFYMSRMLIHFQKLLRAREKDCQERLSLIHQLQAACDERLDLINELHSKLNVPAKKVN